jgi:D-amino-acid dehydrogenase
MFSYTEARQHHYRYGLVDANTQTDFRRRVGEGGWLCTPAPDLGRNDEEWIREFERMPQWLAGQYDQDIVRMNKRSYQGWLALMASDPDLFADVGFRERLFRIYSTQEQLEKAKLRESDYGSLQGILDRAALARECPSLEKAIATGAVAGGLEVAGFSVNVHSFGLRLMRRIGSLGGTFRWNESVQRVAWSGGAVVAGLHLRDGSLLTADHYVLSPGAYGDGLLEGTASHGKIAGMVGMWLTIPNDPPRMEVPLKISRSGFGAPGAAEGANAIPGKTPEGQDVLHLSSGHGYVGVQRKPLSAQALEELARAVEQTAAVYFKDKYEALSPNDLQRPYRYCIRPWTPSGLGLFEAIPANDGGTLVVAGGHSTGGFAQAPVVAEAVLDALSGRRHEMASIYHPRRLERFLA